MSFSLVVLLVGLSANTDAYVIDTGLSWDDCRAASAHVESFPLGESLILIDAETPVLCELEQG